MLFFIEIVKHVKIFTTPFIGVFVFSDTVGLLALLHYFNGICVLTRVTIGNAGVFQPL